MVSTSLPTDNLYKFLAIAGLSLLFFCVYLAYARSEESLKGAVHLSKQSRIIELEQDALTEKLKTAPKDRTLQNAQYELTKRRAQVREEIRAFTDVYEPTRQLINQLFGVSALGISIACLGFYFWYSRVQRYLDIAIKTQKT